MYQGSRESDISFSPIIALPKPSFAYELKRLASGILHAGGRSPMQVAAGE